MAAWTFQSATETFNWNFNITVTNGSTLSMAYSSAVNVGDLLLLNISTSAAFTWTISDTQGNTWFQVSPFVDRGDGYKGSLWWAVAKTPGANTVQAQNNSGVSATSLAWEIASFSPPGGPPILDVTATATGNSTSPEVMISTSRSNELVVAGIVPFGGSTAPLSGFSATNVFGGNNNPMVYATEPSSGAYLPGVSHPTNIWGAIGASFKYVSTPIQKKRKSVGAALFTGREYNYYITLERLF
jgi:hypothetical protein